MIEISEQSQTSWPLSVVHNSQDIVFEASSDTGWQRSHNEDAWSAPVTHANQVRRGTLLALADGVGGLPGGAEASRAAVTDLQAIYYSEGGPDHPGERLRFAVESVNILNRLAKRSSTQGLTRVTTLVAAVVYADHLWVANVGDSRAYHLRAASRRLVQLTEDHSGHIFNVKAGLVEEKESTSQRSGIITRAIGLSEDCQVDTYHYLWQPDDRLVLCSDGLVHLTLEAMQQILLENPVETAASGLVARAVERDGSDNCTALVAAWLPQRDAAQATNQIRPAQPVPDSFAKVAHQPVERPTKVKRSMATAPRRGWSSVGILLLLGLLLGWLSAALLLILLQASGIIHLL